MKDYLNRFGVQVVRLKPTDEAMTYMPSSRECYLYLSANDC